MVATEADEEPVMAPKQAQVTTEEMSRPPCKRPSQRSMQVKRSRAIPVWKTILPMNTKSGMHSRMKSVPVCMATMMVCCSMLSSPATSVRPTAATAPRAKVTGTPMTSRKIMHARP